jgi:phosphate transport system substrate-binding protein
MRLSHALALIVGAGMVSSAPATAWAQQITGAGSTFAAPLYQKWAEAAGATIGVTLNYQPNGSGAGQKLIFARTVDFGASDAPVSADKLAQHKLLQFPTAIGALDIAINLPGMQPNQLKLTGKLLAGIYLGTITKWNDPAIEAVNSGATLPDLAIAPVYRADGSGTTFVFTSYLSKVAPDFQSKVGAANAVSWPAGTGAKGNAGVAGTVKNTVGGLGYVESAYATQNNLTTVQLQTHDGAFLTPSAAAFAAASSNANWAGAKNFAVDMNDAPGAQSWPIVSTTFVLLPTDPAEPARSAAVLKFFGWALSNGDPIAQKLQYVPLPATVKDAVKAAWAGLGQK